jgi:CMP-N-acetylneuraminic acid synthetase|tara:strand:+ start:2768 stop:3481 length:714 start_codon:yes stop_codon:yes gene_type:complete
MILGIIPARGGSKGLPGKNIKLLAGRPMIGYTIEAAIESGCFDRLVVSTDCNEIAAVCREYGVEVIIRPKEYATDIAPIDLALKHAVEAVEKNGDVVQTVVWLQPNVPIRKAIHIGDVISRLESSEADSVMTVSAVGWPIEKACRIENGELKPYFGKTPKYACRQDYTSAYFCNGSIYAMKRDVLMRDLNPEDGYDYFFGEKRVPYLFERYEYGIEIDDYEAFALCEMFMSRKLGQG